MTHEVASQALGTARIYWTGAHATQIVSGRPVNSPLGKLHSEGLAMLRSHGWERVPASDPRLPGFAFTTRKGADFPVTGPGLPHVRQFPQRCTAVLDDKARLAQCLEAAGCAAVAPRTWTDLDAFLEQHSLGGSGSGSASTGGSSDGSRMAAGSAPSGSNTQLYFLKHRHGVKGQAVYPFTSLPALLDRLRSLGGGFGSQQGGHQQDSGQEEAMQPDSSSSAQPGGNSCGRVDNGPCSSSCPSGAHHTQQAAARGGGSRQHFVVQEGAGPPLLLPDGRKFTLRAHVLLLLEHPAHEAAGNRSQQAQEAQARQQQGQGQEQPAAQQPQPEQPEQQGPWLRAWVHEDVIVTPHAAPLAAGSRAAGAAGAAAGTADVAVHVSSRGRGHPKPFLLSQLDLEQLQPKQPQLEQLAQQQQRKQERQQQGTPALQGQQPLQQPPPSVTVQLQQELWQQICSISRAAVAAGAQHGLLPSRADPQAVLYHLWAFDFAVAASPAAGQQAAGVDRNLPAAFAAAACRACSAAEAEDQPAQAPPLPPLRPRVLLLEANSYPAIASGTMAAVPRSIYTRLVGDLLSLVVLPALGSGSKRAGQGVAGGFVRVL